MSFDENQQPLTDLGYLLAEAPKNVVFVVGAGLSAPADVPCWKELCCKLKERAEDYLEHADIDEEMKEKHESRLGVEDLWILGDSLKDLIPRDDYVTSVRRLLKHDHVPATYEAIWELSPSGIVSFNLDEIAETSFRGPSEHHAAANEPSKYRSFLLLTRPFLFQPHGKLRDPDSWVLGARSRNKLLKDSSNYKRFVSNLLGSRRLVIVGFRPIDFVFESLLLEDFRSYGEQRRVSHFWITPSLSEEEKAWAENYNLAPIEYQPSSDDHPEVFDILEFLTRFSPREPRSGVLFEGIDVLPLDELPDDDELRRESVEAIRLKLNAVLGWITRQVGDDHDLLLERINSFIQQYSGSIHMAWLVSQTGDSSRLCSYVVKEKIGEGGFADVWKCVDPVDGDVVAIKVLRENLMRETDFLEAFRRGVNAMKILRDGNIRGMARFRRAFDLPACVVMDYVQGIPLNEACNSKVLSSLVDVLVVIRRVAEIVHDAHQLPEQVLHRDLKPANVILCDPWSGAFKDLVVLDFDLSWYEGALGRSTFEGGWVNPYVAPEQLRRTSSAFSSRHTGVDTFGLGMLLHCVCTGDDPNINVQDSSNFLGTLIEGIRERWSPAFGSITLFLARLIRDATFRDQAARISIPSFMDRLSLAIDVLKSESLPIGTELVLIEISSSMGEFWVENNDNEYRFSKRLTSTTSGASIELEIVDHGPRPELTIRLTCQSGPDVKRSNVTKYLRSRAEKAASYIVEGGYFSEQTVELGHGTASVEAHLKKQQLSARDVKRVIDRVRTAASTLAFSDYE